MPENIAALKNKFVELQKAYDHKCLDLKKVKLDAQTNRLKHENGCLMLNRKS